MFIATIRILAAAFGLAAMLLTLGTGQSARTINKQKLAVTWGGDEKNCAVDYSACCFGSCPMIGGGTPGASCDLHKGFPGKAAMASTPSGKSDACLTGAAGAVCTQTVNDDSRCGDARLYTKESCIYGTCCRLGAMDFGWKCRNCGACE